MPTLAGPADADHYRVSVGRFGQRWYADPLPADDIAGATEDAWPSVSAVKKASSSDWSFVTVRRVAQQLEANPVEFSGLTDAQDIADRMHSINKAGLRQASERGTNVHLYFERGLYGQSIEPVFPGEPGSEYIDSVRSFFDAYQPELYAAELVCINRDLHGVGYGGTGDGIIRIGAGQYKGALLWVDWKSRGEQSKHGAYAEEAQQLAAYNEAQYCITAGDDGTPVRQPMPEVDGGIIVSIKPDGYRVYPIDLDKAKAHWEARHAFWVDQRTDRDPIGKPWAPVAATDPVPGLIESAASYDELTSIYRQNSARWTTTHTELASARKAALAA